MTPVRVRTLTSWDRAPLSKTVQLMGLGQGSRDPKPARVAASWHGHVRDSRKFMRTVKEVSVP